MLARRVALGLILAAVLGSPVTAAGQSGYVNPFAGPDWAPARTDMGVDWIPLRPTPVRAIGDAVILGSDSHARWPGKHVLWYQLTDGSHAGAVIYVAEHLRRLLPAGTTVHAGQTIAIALPGYPWLETGWATQFGSPRAYPCYKEGKPTNSGREMARFLESLGATVADRPGAGPGRPTGKLC
jgi:murein DD-endopeptidase MepM/ murein hydrolase activator NlpD